MVHWYQTPVPGIKDQLCVYSPSAGAPALVQINSRGFSLVRSSVCLQENEDGEIREEEFSQNRQRLVVQCKVSSAA